jgi:hypothetical protein
MIRKEKVLKDFTNRTEADLYAWMLLHRAAFEGEIKSLGFVPEQDLIEEVKRERATNPFARLMGSFRLSMELHNLPLKVERAKFLEATGLDEIRPDHNIKFTEAGCYQLTKRHIDVHKYLKETECNCAIPYSEAVASWYDNVYMPLIALIRERGLQKSFPKNTEADLYLWLISRRKAKEDERHAIGAVPDEEIIEELEQENQSSPIATLANFFNQPKLDLKSIVANAPDVSVW